MRTCEVPGCNRKHEAKGYCHSHYARVSRGLPAGGAEFRRYVEGATCEQAGCAERHHSDGYCAKHALRVRRYQDPNVVKRRGVPFGGKHHRWQESPTYKAAHARIRREAGSASLYFCECGEQAREWSYNYNDPDELLDADTGLKYSLHRESYTPRCAPCHRRMDAGMRRAEAE